MASTTSKRGAFVVIEGLDRSGKSTQASAVLSRLQENGIRTKLLKFPDRTAPIGKMIDAYLKSQSDLDDRAIHLLFSANRWELAASIERDLCSGIFILADRYAFSGIAFSQAKGLPYEWCQSPGISLPAPDLTLFLDISPDKARERGGYGEERYEKEGMQRKVREMFKHMGKEMAGADSSRWINIDAGLPVKDVTDSIWNVISPLIDGISQPLHRLWTDTV
ncbi:thymidylate kinase [Amanita muscaria]